MSEKCTANIGLKVPSPLKEFYDDLPPEIKKQAKGEIIEVIERAIHNARFKRGMYSGLNKKNNYEDEE